ncbi:MAG TPA: nucleotidyltransferase domain-containing protein [Candidatus Nanoarchaeia archaeon]|nr:nucleotidyltransferase domain-containing protein [Candidatus Nanoarchaeia archaeon]
MEFSINPNEKGNISRENLIISRKFASQIYKEFGNFIAALVVFGSTIDPTRKKKGDIDILVVIDDVHIILSPEILETYKIIVEKAILNTDQRLHIQTMKLSSFWEYVRAGDPVAINILRGGLALIDTGFFDPLQLLLKQGRIRPSAEAIYTYFSMSYGSLVNSRKNLLNAMLDLYWACIDAAHAALMKVGEIPPSPQHVSDKLRERLVSKKLIDRKHVSTMHEMYTISRKILHNELREVSGKDYDHYKQRTEEFIQAMKKFIEKH